MSNESPSRTLWIVLALAIVVAFAAIGGVGYLIGRSGDSSAPAAETSAAAPASTTAPQPAATADATATSPAEEAPGTPIAAPAKTTEAGRRYRQSSPATPPATSSETSPAPEPATAEAAPPQPILVTIPAGTKIDLRLTAAVSSQTATVGDPVRAELASPIVVDGRTVVPRGASVRGSVTEAHALKKIGGQARLAMSFDRIDSDEGPIAIQAGYSHEGKSETGKDAATIAAGAVVGTVLGNQARNNKRGKVVGGLIGAGVGTAIAASTPGEKVELAAGSTLHLTLRSDSEARVRP